MKNPFKWFKKKVTAAKSGIEAQDRLENLDELIQAEQGNIKHILMSKTFWINLLGLLATIGGLLPPRWGVPTLSIVNILLRLVSNQPVTIKLPLKDDSKKG